MRQMQRGDAVKRDIFGKVIAVSKAGPVEIDLGSDDGLKIGATLDAFRLGSTLATTRYLGQVRLTAVNKTTAQGEVLPGAKGNIEEHDHVITTLP